MPLDEATRRRVRIRARALDYMAEEEAAPGGGAVEAPEPESPPLFGGAGFMGHAAEVPAGILRGFTGMGAGAMKGAALAGAGAGELMGGGESDPRQSSLYQAARDAEAWALRTGGTPNPNARFGAGAGEAIGSGLAAIPAAAAAFYAGLPAFGTAAVTGGLALLAGAGQDYEEKRAKGIDDATARMSAAAQGALQGITEPLGLGGSRFAGKMLGRVPSAIGRSIFREGGEETVQEAIQGVGGDIIDRIMTDPNQRIGENIGEKMLFGAIGGGVLGGAGSAVGERMRQRQAATAPPVPAPQPPPPTAPPAPITQAPDGRPIKVSDRASITGQPDLGSFAGKGEILGNPNVDPAAPTAPLVAPDDPNAAPAPPPPESPLGKLGARQQFTPEEADRFQKVVTPWAKGMKITMQPEGALIEAPSGWSLYVSKVDRIPPEAIEGGPEMLAREIARNPGMDYGEGDPRGVTLLPNEFNYKFKTADGLEFDTDTVVALAGGATPDTLPFELWRVSMANLLTGEEQRRIRRDFGTDEAAAAHYAQMVDRRTSHPVLWRMREFFQRLADWVGRGFKRDPQGQSKAIMRDVASGKMWNRPGTRMAAGPGFGRQTGFRVGNAEAGDPGGTNAALRAAAQRKADEDLARRAMTVAPLGPPSPQPAGGLAPYDFEQDEMARLQSAMEGPVAAPARAPQPPPATVAPDATVQAPAAPTVVRPTVTKGGGTRESPKAPPRPAKRVSKLPEKPMNLLGMVSKVSKGGRQKIEVTPSEASEIARYLDVSKGGYYNGRTDIAFRDNGERFVPKAGFHGIWKMHFSLAPGDASMASMAGRARAEGGLKRLAPFLQPQLRAVAQSAVNEDEAAKIISDPDVPDIIRALAVDDQNFYSSQVAADAAAEFEAASRMDREIAVREREAYENDVAEGFEGSLDDWRAARAREMESRPPGPVQDLPFQPARARADTSFRVEERKGKFFVTDRHRGGNYNFPHPTREAAEADAARRVAKAEAEEDRVEKFWREKVGDPVDNWGRVFGYTGPLNAAGMPGDSRPVIAAAVEKIRSHAEARGVPVRVTRARTGSTYLTFAHPTRAGMEGPFTIRVADHSENPYQTPSDIYVQPSPDASTVDDALGVIDRMASGAAFQPAKKDVFSARQATLPEMPEGPRPSSQRMFGLDLQPPTVETGENREADPDTPDMFTGETGAKKAPKTAPKRKAPGGQGSFGFQPAAATPDPERVSEIQVWLKENVEGAFPKKNEDRVAFVRDSLASYIADYEIIEHPETLHTILYTLSSYANNVATVPYVGRDEAAARDLEDRIIDAFDLDSRWELTRNRRGEMRMQTPDYVADEGIYAYADNERSLIHLENQRGTFSVKAVHPDDLGPEHVVFAEDRAGKPIDPYRLFDDSEEGLASRVVGEDLSVDYFRAMSESPAIQGVIANWTGGSVAFQPKSEPQKHQREGDAIATASATQRKPKPDAALIAGAEKLAADPGGVESMLRKAAADDRVLSDEETVAAYWVASEISVKAAASGDSADVDRAITTWRAYEKVGSEAGRALRARRVRTEAERVRAMIAESLFGMSREDAKAFDAAKTKEEKAKILARARKQTEARIAAAAKAGIDAPAALVGQELTESLGDFEAESIAKLEAELAKLNKASQAEKRNQIRAAIREVRRMAKDAPTLAGEEKAARRWASQRIKAIRKFLFGFQPGLADGIEAAFAPALKAMADRSGTNAVTGARIARAAQTVDAGFGDMAREWWINSILSGPQTQIVNVLSNVAEGLWTATMRAPETAFAEIARMVGIDRNGPNVGELREFYRGVAPGIAIGIRNGLRAWAIEDSVLSRGMGNASEVGRKHAIPGRFGTVVRTPGRVLLAFDELFKGIAFRMELGAQAWRAGKAKGLSGASLRSFVEKQTVEPDDAIFAAAVAHAERTTFNQDPGKLAKAVGAFRTALPAAGYVVPFISTPMNLIRTSVRRTPLGTANLALGLAREAAARIAGTPGGYRYETKYRDAVEQVVAWSALVALAGAMGDEDDPIITGSKQFDVDRKSEIDLAYRQAPPQSVKIGGKWYSYARADPFAAGLTLMVDGLRNLGKAKDGVEAASTVWRSSLGIISNATFLRGLSDFLEMVNTGDVKNWATNFATSWVPNIVRQPARAFEPNVLERKDQPASEIMKQGAFPARRGALVPKVDVWGRDVKAGVSPFGPTTDIPYRILWPVRVQEEDAGTPRELDRFIMRYNAMFPDAKWFPSTPDSKFSDGRGGTVQLTPSEYRDFLRTSGENAVKRLKGLRPLPPDASPRAMENRLAGIKRALDDARADARKRIAATKRRGQSVTR